MACHFSKEVKGDRAVIFQEVKGVRVVNFFFKRLKVWCRRWPREAPCWKSWELVVSDLKRSEVKVEGTRSGFWPPRHIHKV